MTATVEILLATWNGADHLPELLAGIAGQSHSNWRLLIRDDGSTDRTGEILADFQRQHRDRVRILEDGDGNLGPCRNFLTLLEHSHADYLMFCDQDDLWLPDKIALTLERMQSLEKSCGNGLPLLVHTDFKVVDEQLQILASSGHHYQRLDPVRGAQLPRLLVQNVVTGCTAMINARLRRLVLPVPDAALMHDHWLALTAAAFGKIGYVATPTLLYRQHQSNQVGAAGWSSVALLRQISNLPQVRASFVRNYRQAEAFLMRFDQELPGEARQRLLGFSQLPHQNWLRRRITIVTQGFTYCGLLRNIGWGLLC